MDETTETLYINMFVNNNNQTNSSSIPCQIRQQFNTLIDDLSMYNIYINSITLSSGELPYCNVYKNIKWDASNFATNKLNWSITLYDNTGYNFNLTANNNLLISGIDANPLNNNTYKGVAVFLQYLSENDDPSLYPNPNVQGTGANTANYPLGYFNIHSIQQVLDFINTAILTGLNTYQPTISDKTFQFAYNPNSSLYNLYMSDQLKTSNINFYANSFLERYLDGFRWIFLKNTDIINEVPYRGMSFEFVKNNFVVNKGSNNIWTYTAEFGTIQNLLDIHSLIVTCDGSLSVIQKQVFQATASNNVNPQTSCILKSLDFVFNSQSASINNSTIQFEAQTLDRPINILATAPLNDIQLDFHILNIDGSFIPIYISSNGIANIKFCLKRRINKNTIKIKL